MMAEIGSIESFKYNTPEIPHKIFTPAFLRVDRMSLPLNGKYVHQDLENNENGLLQYLGVMAGQPF
jgi:hypothetical protein